MPISYGSVGEAQVRMGIRLTQSGIHLMDPAMITVQSLHCNHSRVHEVNPTHLIV